MLRQPLLLRTILRYIAPEISKINNSYRFLSQCPQRQLRFPQDFIEQQEQDVDQLEPVRLVHEVIEGKSKDPPVIFAHGLLGSKRNFLSIAKRLNKMTDRTMVVVDLRNHGDSPHTDAFSLELMALDLQNLVENDLKFPSYTFLGHSLGGKVVAVNSLLWPKSLDKLIVVDVAPVRYGTTNVSNAADMVNAIGSIDLQLYQTTLPDNRIRSAIRQKLYSQLKAHYLVDFILTNLIYSEGVYKWKCHLESLRDNLTNIFGIPKIPDSRLYSGETLFIAGALSPYIQPEHESEISRFYPNSSIIRVDGAGHWVHADKPAEFIKLVFEFLTH